MKPSFTRRDFLKFASLLSLSCALPPTVTSLSAENQPQFENVLILVFDAWSAANMSLYGYQRETTPNLERLADKAIVYHNHYAGSHYTTPGTASLLTGTTPWVHHAFDLHAKLEDHLAERTIFDAFSQYHRLTYTHNPLVQALLKQFTADIDELTPRERLFFESDPLFATLFDNDFDAASVSRNQAFRQKDDGFSYSLFLAKLYENHKRRSTKKVAEYFPRGVPGQGGLDFFLLEDAIDWIMSITESTSQPFLGYYHLYPPHSPYHTRLDFIDTFAHDNYKSTPKPKHFLKGISAKGSVDQQRRWYDEFVLYVDSEFARLYHELEQNGILENTWLVLTTDHGEMFERGIMGHLTPVFYQPIMRVPLLIFPPGQESRVDVYDNTSAIDLLPTLLHATGQSIPGWAEGKVIAPFSESTSSETDDISSIQVEFADKDGNVLVATAMLIRGNYKLIWSFGYEQIDEGELIELYNIASDPEELHDLSRQRKDIADEFLAILKIKLQKL
ncbi:MAG: sulfatase-like hydrolase/transferase [Chloroflexota bacterium]|nr:sulfatase-like hydrolase/transferase [Chloroflexota bacterium]